MDEGDLLSENTITIIWPIIPQMTPRALNLESLSYVEASSELNKNETSANVQ